MKKILFIIFLIIPFTLVSALDLPVDVTADSVILVNLTEDDIIYTKNPDKKQILASLTKIMTVYTALQKQKNINKKVTLTEEDLSSLWNLTLVGFEVGDTVTYKDLLYGTMLKSGGDAAQALAIHTYGSIDKFVEAMNKNAANLGLRHTKFVDPTGIGDDNVSTAREMYILLNECLKNDTYKKIFETSYYTTSNGIEVQNYTRALATFHGYDEYLIKGNKSGYTDEAGLLLASTATINDIDYMLITMKSNVNEYKTQHVIDSYAIYNYIIEQNYQKRLILQEGKILKTIDVYGATTSEYYVTLEHDIKEVLSDKEYQNLNIKYNIVDSISSDIEDNTNLGYVDIYVGDELIDSFNVYFSDKLFKSYYNKTSNIIIIACIVLGIFILSLLLANMLYYKKRKI